MDALFDRLLQNQVVVVRWDKNGEGKLPVAATCLQFIKKLHYQVADTDRVKCMPSPEDHNQFIILPLQSEEEAKRLCNDAEHIGFGLDDTRLAVNMLIGPKGVRLCDVADCVRLWQDQCGNNELMVLFIAVTSLECTYKQEVADGGFSLIQSGIDQLIENGTCDLFGSYPSPSRRNGYSDLDINIESVDLPDKAGSTSVRPLQQIIDNPTCLQQNPLTKAEFYTYPPEEIIKALYRCFSESDTFAKFFNLRYLPARTPIIVFTDKTDLELSYDVSVNNMISVGKANLLDSFIEKDQSKTKTVGKVMKFVVHWAKSNRLMSGAYPEEKAQIKTRFNSYVFNQLIIHFVQVRASKVLVFPQAKPEDRVVPYDFDKLFASSVVFLKEFFKYYANFDFTNKAIYGKQVMQKKTLSLAHGVPVSPFMMIDPMDCTHNLTAKVPEEGIRLFNGLIRNALLILKQKNVRLSYLLRTNEMANTLMHNKPGGPTSVSASQVPAALAEFVSAHGGTQDYLTFHLPDIITKSDEFMLLLTRILRFQISPSHVGTSVANLYNSMGVVFVVHSRSWIGRRNRKRFIQTKRRDLTNLQLDVLCSDSFKMEEELVAEFRMAMSDVAGSTKKSIFIEVLKGQVAEVRDSMHFVNQFLINNIEELHQFGIMSIEKIPNLINQHL